MISKNLTKQILALHSKKNRDEKSLFIVEGEKIIIEFISSDKYKIDKVVGTNQFKSKYFEILHSKSISFIEVSEDELKKISSQTNPNQALAIVHKLNVNSSPINSVTGIALYLDDIRDPGNFGTIIRIADWFGINQVFCSKNTTELYNPKTLQATMGAILRVNVTYVSIDLLLKENLNTKVYGAVLNGNDIYKTKLENGIIVIGNESNGISEPILNLINDPITIPSSKINGSESLNAANACAIICSEFHRQLNY
jgi:TrmH family RNA methyltransferase